MGVYSAYFCFALLYPSQVCEGIGRKDVIVFLRQTVIILLEIQDHSSVKPVSGSTMTKCRLMHQNR